MRTRFVAERDADLQDELDRLKVWAEDEYNALMAKQDDYRRRIAILKDKATATTVFVERFQWKQKAAELERERTADEERIERLAADLRRRRDEYMAAARAKSTARFWDEEMFVASFRVVSGTQTGRGQRRWHEQDGASGDQREPS